jgi:hypothetical protein
MNIAGYDHDEPMIYGKLAIDAHDAKIRAEALKDAADRAVACVKGFTSEMRDLWSECEDQELRAAILAGEVKE